MEYAELQSFKVKQSGQILCVNISGGVLVKIKFQNDSEHRS